MKSPQTCFYRGNASDAFSEVPDLELSETMSQLLFVVGFWKYCLEHVEVSNSIVFNGPWEGGYLSPEELSGFERAARRFSMQQPPDPDRQLTGVFATDTGGNPVATPAVSVAELQEALLAIARLAADARAARQRLWVST